MILFAFALLAGLQLPQNAPSQDASDQSDVTVTGVRLASPEETEGIDTPNGGQAIANRDNFSKSAVFAKCIRNIDSETIRKIIDGPPNRADTRFAQGLLISKHISCYLDVQAPPLPAAPLNTIAAGASRYDRGALLEQVFAQYAPDPKLTVAETMDPIVQQRFDTREVPRNRWRLSLDYKTFAIAVCLVRLQPVATVSLLRSKPGSKQEKSLEETILVRAKVCVGDARRITFDAVSLRLYLIDALYRWVVAARGVDTLIGDEPLNPR